MTTEQATKIVIKKLGEDFLALLSKNPGYTPTIPNARLAKAINTLGRAAWNPKTGKNW